MSEGEAAHLGWGDGSPGSREADGEGGEGFYIAQSSRYPDLLVIPGGEGGATLGAPSLDICLSRSGGGA